MSPLYREAHYNYHTSSGQWQRLYKMICIIIYCTVYDCIILYCTVYVHIMIPFDGVALSCPLSCEHHSLLKLKHLRIHVKFILHCACGFHICSTYVQCVGEECEGLLYIASYSNQENWDWRCIYVRLHEELYVKFQFYTVHYIVDYSSMLSSADAHTNCTFLYFH